MLEVGEVLVELRRSKEFDFRDRRSLHTEKKSMAGRHVLQLLICYLSLRL